MVKLGDAARFTGGDLPDVSTPGALDLAAFQVWEKARATVRESKDVKWPRDGRPGYLVEGMSVSGLIAEIWPAMQDRIAFQLDPDHQAKAKEIGVKLNRHLRETGNLECTSRPGIKRKSVWWVAARYTATSYGNTAQAVRNEQEEEVMENVAFSNVEAVVPVTPIANSIPRATFQQPPAMPVVDEDEHDTEEIRKEDMSKNTKPKGAHAGHPSSSELPCRGADNCTQKFLYPQLRSSHEKRIHGKIFDSNGKLTSSFDVTAAPLSDEDVRMMVAMVLEASKQPMPMRLILSATRELDPRVSQPMIKRVLDHGVSTQGSGIKYGPTIGSGVYTYYEYAKPTDEAVKVIGDLIENTPSSTTEKNEDTTVSTATTTAPNVGDGTLAGVIITLDDAMITLRALEAREAALAAEAAAHQGKADELAKVTGERDKAQADLRVTNALLVAVTAERDRLRESMDTLQKTLGLQN